MSTPQTDIDISVKIKDLEEENELLLLQLHQVQEELEVYFLKYKDLEAGAQSNASSCLNQGWVDEELPEALAEVERLKTLADIQRQIKAIEDKNALNVRLGNILLEATSSVGGIGKLPFSLLVFWRNATKTSPPSELGGKEFTAVLKAYDDRGFVGVKSLLKGDVFSPMIKGNAYTALARYLMRVDSKAAAEAATKAFEIDPKSYRLKWLACRLHEAGDAIKAEAMIDLLPQDQSFSESEARQVSQIRYEAKSRRQREARQKTHVVSRQQQIQQQISELKGQIEALSKEKANLIQEKSTLSQEKVALTTARDEQTKLAADRQSQINALTEQKNQLAQSRESAVKQSEELKGQIEALSKEKESLNHLREELVNKESIQEAMQQRMKEEMIRAEAQLEVIKDILLREPGI